MDSMLSKQLVGTVVVPATTKRFIAKEKFLINTKHYAPVKINYIGEDFIAWFLNGDGKIEDRISEQHLCYHKVPQCSTTGSIIAELGGEAKVETTLSEMFSLIEKQKNRESGPLLNNGLGNLFYVRDQRNVLRVIDVGWQDNGWYIIAYPVKGLGKWHGLGQVFSRVRLESSEFVPASH